MTQECPFCAPRLDEGRVTLSNDLCLFLRSDDPILQGSGIIIPRAHRSDLFALSNEEWAASFELLVGMRGAIDQALNPDGYNVGWNCGEMAGQKVSHCHMHVLPRFRDEPLAGRGIRYWLKQESNRRRRQLRADPLGGGD